MKLRNYLIFFLSTIFLYFLLKPTIEGVNTNIQNCMYQVQNICKKCKKGYQLNNNGCSLIKIPKCVNQSEQRCHQCAAGYYPYFKGKKCLPSHLAFHWT